MYTNEAINESIFWESAIDTVKGHSVLKNRTKISTDDVIEVYPDGVTITGFELLTGRKGEQFPALLIKEDPGVFFNGGTTLTAIVNKWLEHFNGDAAACSKALDLSGGVKVKLSRSATKDGRSWTRVEIVK